MGWKETRGRQKRDKCWDGTRSEKDRKETDDGLKAAHIQIDKKQSELRERQKRNRRWDVTRPEGDRRETNVGMEQD